MSDSKSAAHIGGFYAIIAAILGAILTVVLTSYLNSHESTVNEKKENSENITLSKTHLVSDPNGNQYNTVSLVGRTWLAENLDYYIEGSYCYNNDLKNCKEFGKLYTLKAAREGCRALGNGWRLPNEEELKELADFYGGYRDAEWRKTIGDPTKGYQALIDGGQSSFAALLGGDRDKDGAFSGLGTAGSYWTNTEKGRVGASYFSFNGNNGYGGKLYLFNNYKTDARSVRCIKD